MYQSNAAIGYKINILSENLPDQDMIKVSNSNDI